MTEEAEALRRDGQTATEGGTRKASDQFLAESGCAAPFAMRLPEPPRRADQEDVMLLPRSDFESAVKDALRYYTQADLLTENALLQTRLLTRSESSLGTPQALRTMLA
jgi:hypothetical protein